MSSKHTPGPWTAKFGPGFGGGYQGVDGPNGERVALCDEDGSLPLSAKVANARLIAAAPDLLAALRDVDAAWTPERGRRLEGLLGTTTLNKVRAAIARAEGRGA